MSRLTLPAVALFGLLSYSSVRADDITVKLNGSTVNFEGTQPRQYNGRVLVPLRGVLERMGATVDWLANEQTVVAAKNNLEINLPIGSHFGTVNGRRVELDVPAMTIAGSTMVPLRFVSESLGADVTWSDATQTVMIETAGPVRAYRRPPPPRDNPPAREYYRAPRPANRAILPSGVVIPARLDADLRSNEAQPGDRFTATVVSGRDDAELPNGTKFEGIVRESVPSRSGKPGVLDVDFRRIIFPNGTDRPVVASLTGMDSKYTTRDESGRLVAKSRQGEERLKWVGIGAGAGLLISTLTKGNILVNTILGAGAGYLFNEVQRKGAGDVHLRPGTEIGIRIDQRLAYDYSR